MVTKAQDRPVLEVEARKTTGRKIKKLRQKGILPANVYGKGVKSISVQGDYKGIAKIYDQQGETGLIDLTIKGEKKPRPVLISNPQYHPVRDSLLHLDFHQVDLTQKILATIPIEINGEAPAVAKNEGVLVQVLNEIEVEALPTDLPEQFAVDISKLEKIDDAITIADLKIGDKLELKAAPDQVIVKISPLAKEEEVAPTPAAEGEAAAAAGAPAAEGAKPEVGGEKPAEGKPASPTQQGKPAEEKPAEEKK